MYEKFTGRAMMVLQLANQEAQKFNMEWIGAEHILLGLALEGSGVAAHVLKESGATPEKIRQEIEKITEKKEGRAVDEKLPQTPRAKKLIEYAMEEARALCHNYVGTEHLLLGLVRESEGHAINILKNLKTAPGAIRARILDLLGRGEEKKPEQKELSSPERKKSGVKAVCFIAGPGENGLEKLNKFLSQITREQIVSALQSASGDTVHITIIYEE